jgi:UDP-glucose 4-epimerase
MIENIIRDWTKVDSKRRGTVLRYFNPVGAHESGQIGEKPIEVLNNLCQISHRLPVGAAII